MVDRADVPAGATHLGRPQEGAAWRLGREEGEDDDHRAAGRGLGHGQVRRRPRRAAWRGP